MSFRTRRSSDYFDAAYRHYESQNPARKLDHYIEGIRYRLPVPNPRPLDLGCGPGLFLRRAHDRYTEWDFGIDVEREPCRRRQAESRSWVELMTDHFQDVEWHGISRYLLTSQVYVQLPPRSLPDHTPAILMTEHRR